MTATPQHRKAPWQTLRRTSGWTRFGRPDFAEPELWSGSSTAGSLRRADPSRPGRLRNGSRVLSEGGRPPIGGPRAANGATMGTCVPPMCSEWPLSLNSMTCESPEAVARPVPSAARCKHFNGPSRSIRQMERRTFSRTVGVFFRSLGMRPTRGTPIILSPEKSSKRSMKGF
ncbi:MAG: hypothetical protein U0T81_19745 [Saprospiraceae bacterium]